VVAPQSVRGFTLLEAIVALVIFTMGALALYGWLSTNVIALGRIRAQQEQERVQASALDLVRRGNPMLEPEGQRLAGDLRVTWRAKLVEPAKPAVSQSGVPGLFAVGLYALDVRIERDGAELQQFEVRQVGWKQIRAGEAP
jgi:general secretion pathway protein I